MKRYLKKQALFIILIALPFMLLTGVSVFALQGEYEVVIDPAHGGTEAGVNLSRNLNEKDVTLEIAKMIQQNLGKAGNVRVKLTRSADSDISIKDRKKMVDKSKTDLFISIHINAGFGDKSTGYEIYYSSSQNRPASAEGSSKEIVDDMIESRYLNDSILFAQIVRKNIEKIFPREGRGIRSAPVFVLEGLTVPAVEIELGFATNIKSRKQLADEEIQRSIADGLTKSIKEFFTSSGV
jgi:N-acetylmuramoyl-L-alanine amidase